MSIQDRNVPQDKFEFEEVQGGLDLPCICCKHRHGKDNDAPCSGCGHNVMSTAYDFSPDSEETPVNTSTSAE